MKLNIWRIEWLRSTPRYGLRFATMRIRLRRQLANSMIEFRSSTATIDPDANSLPLQGVCNRSKSLIFALAFCPAVAGATQMAIAVYQGETQPQGRKQPRLSHDSVSQRPFPSVTLVRICVIATVPAYSCDAGVDGIVGVGIDHAEARRDLGVEEPDVLLLNQRQKPLCFLVGDDELNLHGERARQFKKGSLVQCVMPSESRHGLKRRASADAEFIRLLHQPFPYEVMVMAMTLVHIKSQK